MAATGPPNLPKYNKWTQYLARNILLEICEMCRDLWMGRDPPIQGTIVWHVGFDRPLFERAFPEVKWCPGTIDKQPLPDEEFDKMEMWQLEDCAQRITEAQFARHDSDLWADMVRNASPQIIAWLASNPHINIARAADLTARGDEYSVASTRVFLARRLDLTADVAHFVLQHAGSQRQIILDRIARNWNLNMDEVYELCGAIPALLSNHAFTQDHMTDPRFAALVKGDPDQIGTAANCNFPVTDATILCAPESTRKNPRLLPHQMARLITIPADFNVALWDNQFNQHPYWNAKCRRREAARAAWLTVAWTELTAMLPPVIADMVLDIWYTPFGAAAP